MIPAIRIFPIYIFASILMVACQAVSGVSATDTPDPTATARPTSTPRPTATTAPTSTTRPTATTRPASTVPPAPTTQPPETRLAFDCGDPLGCVEISPGDAIELASLQVISGSISFIGENQNRMIQIAIDDHGGELLGFPIELTREDTECSADGGAVGATKIVANPQIVAVVGTTCSGAAVAASQILSEAGILMVSGVNTSPSLTAEGYYSASGPIQAQNWSHGYFRTKQSDEFQGIAAAKFAFESLGLTKAATIDDGNPYSAGLASAFGEAFTALGGDWVLQSSIQGFDTDLQPALAEVASSGAQLLFFPVFDPPGRFIVLQRGEIAGLEDLILFGADGLLSESFLIELGQAGVGMYLSGPSEPDNPAYEALRSKYQAAYEEDFIAPFSAQAYDAANMILEAIEAVAIIEEDGSMYIGRQALIDYFYLISGFEGITGTLTCNQFGDCAAVRMAIMIIDSSTSSVADLIANPIEIIELSSQP